MSAAPPVAARFGSGHSVRRIEDPTLVSGTGRYVDDVSIAGQLHVVLLRSPHAHARIASIDASAARAMPGVVAVYTGTQLVELGMGPLPCAWAVTEDMVAPEHLPVAVSEACFVGDAVAVVVAESRYAARDAGLSQLKATAYFDRIAADPGYHAFLDRMHLSR